MGLFDLQLLNRVTGAQNKAQANENGEQLVAFGMPAYAETSRKGQHYGTMATSAVAALVVRPTTTAALQIYNNTGAVPINGKAQTMIVTSIFAHWLVQSTTALGSGAIQYAMVAPSAAPSDAALAINSLSGRQPAKLVVLTAASASCTDNGWFPVGPTVKHESAGAVVPGGGLWTGTDGRWEVPPGCSLYLHVVSGYTGDTFTNGATWAFEPITMVS